MVQRIDVLTFTYLSRLRRQSLALESHHIVLAQFLQCDVMICSFYPSHPFPSLLPPPIPILSLSFSPLILCTVSFLGWECPSSHCLAHLFIPLESSPDVLSLKKTSLTIPSPRPQSEWDASLVLSYPLFSIIKALTSLYGNCLFICFSQCSISLWFSNVSVQQNYLEGLL